MDKTSSLPIDINDQSRIFKLLSKLKSDTPAIFGIMTPQHMVEHLILILQCSNGKRKQKLCYTAEKAEKVKSFILDLKEELPRGFKAPMLPIDALLALENTDLKQALERLKLELNDFQAYFRLNPNVEPIHPITGELTHTEWVTFHNKHFLHHFKQFSIL